MLPWLPIPKYLPHYYHYALPPKCRPVTPHIRTIAALAIVDLDASHLCSSTPNLKYYLCIKQKQHFHPLLYSSA